MHRLREIQRIILIADLLLLVLIYAVSLAHRRHMQVYADNSHAEVSLQYNLTIRHCFLSTFYVRLRSYSLVETTPCPRMQRLLNSKHPLWNAPEALAADHRHP